MLFSLEHDDGDRVVGYCVPDGFSATTQIRVCGRGRTLARLAADEPRPALVAAGRHETGLCGFTVDEAKTPGLSKIADLALYDDETGVLVYRRPRPEHIRRKLVRLETHLVPLWRLDDALKDRFQHHLRGAETFGRETVTQLFLLNQVESSYLAGRFLYRNYAIYIEAGFEVYAIVQEPFAEFAERLLALGKIKQTGSAGRAILGPRDVTIYEPAIAFASQLPFDDPKALKRALRAMPGEVAQRLANPLVRQFTATTPDEMPSGGAVAATLDALSSFTLVGLRHEPARAAAALAELLGLEARALPIPGAFGRAARLARELREIGAIEALLEKDLEVYHHLAEASLKAAETAA
jgi:hypothetical protein